MEDMQTIKFTDIDIANRARMRYFHIGIPKTGDLLIMGDIGYGNYFRMDITFINVKYLACVFFIDDIYTWRVATPEETISVLKAFSTSLFPERERHIIVYCLEEGSNSQRTGRKFFIAARTVEIVVYYDANNPHHLRALGLRP